MLVSGQATFAVRCPGCGRVEPRRVSLFDFAHGRCVRIDCACGQGLLDIDRRPGGQFGVQLPCHLCDGTHFVYFGSREFWSAELKRLVCRVSGLELGVFGGAESVERRADPHGGDIGRIAADAALGDFFDNPQVMYQVLSCVHSLAQAEALVCTCGNKKIEVDIFPDRLELACSDCQRYRAVFAETAEDLAAVRRLNRVEISGDPAAGRGARH